MGDWNWQTSLLLLVVTVSLLGVVANFIVTGSDAPTGIITLLTMFGGAVLGVERIIKVMSRGDADDAKGKAQAKVEPGPPSVAAEKPTGEEASAD